jgi:hypothetical protein
MTPPGWLRLVDRILDELRVARNELRTAKANLKYLRKLLKRKRK